MHLSPLSLCLLKAEGLIKVLVPLDSVTIPHRRKTKPEHNCVVCLCAFVLAVEVLRCHKVHRLARGLQGESGSGSLLPGTLPELWPQLHQYVLEPGECDRGSARGFFFFFLPLPRMVPLYIKAAKPTQMEVDCTKRQRTFGVCVNLHIDITQHMIWFFISGPDCR